MIISPKYKFIFIKTQKTAGSSIEKILLDKIADDENLIFGGMPPENMDPINLDEVAEHRGRVFISRRYPDNGSKTCCHGLTEFGFLIFKMELFSTALWRSGMMRSFEKSPPPITLPDLATQDETWLFKKKELLNVDEISSEHALEVE